MPRPPGALVAVVSCWLAWGCGHGGGAVGGGSPGGYSIGAWKTIAPAVQIAPVTSGSSWLELVFHDPAGNHFVRTFRLDPLTGAPLAFSDTALSADVWFVSDVASDSSGSFFLLASTKPVGPTGSGSEFILPIQPSQGALGVGTEIASTALAIAVVATAGTTLATIDLDPSGQHEAALATFDPSLGTLTTGPPTPVITPPMPIGGLTWAQFAVSDRTGSFVFSFGAPDQQDPGVSVFACRGGALAAVPGSPFLTGSSVARPMTAVVHPTDAFLYTGNVDGTVTVFAFGAGALSNPVTSSPGGHRLRVGVAPVIDPSGARLFTADDGDDTASALAIDPATGALSPIGAAAALPSMPVGLAINASGSVLYVTTVSGTNESLSVVEVSANGALVSAPNGTLELPSGGPDGIVVVP